MKKFILKGLLILVASISLASCGVMFGGSQYQGKITVQDHPEADIYVNGRKIGTGETTAMFKRNQPLVVELKEDGCDNQTVQFNNAFRTGNFILSAVSWGIIGIGVDLGTGASYKPDHANDAAITKESMNDFSFNVEYDKCHKPASTTAAESKK